MKYVNVLNCAGRNYKTRKEAENRMMRAASDLHDTEFERKLAGRGPFTTKTNYAVKGDEEQGFWVEEPVEQD